ncbi:hypothetical protein CDIK_0819 [Cucumispora dikerogammari]|nr:hypothetical protein CDIK_0819 [Cucumispora dikerogammari]
MNPLSLSELFDESKNYGFAENNVGYLYNLKEKKYFNCNNETTVEQVLPILTQIPSAPWTVNEVATTKDFIFKCGNGKVIDIAWYEYITVSVEHGKTNQQFTVDVVSSNRLDEIVLHHLNGKNEKHCFVAKLGRVLFDACDESGNQIQVKIGTGYQKSLSTKLF